MSRALELDRRLFHRDGPAASEEAAGWRERLKECSGASPEAARCAIATLFGPQGLQPLTETAVPGESSISHALVTRRGTCAALAAVALFLTEIDGDPFEAVIFRNHVVLRARGQPGVYFETLEAGREIGESALSRYRTPSPEPPLLVRGNEYLAYYLDNLAARFVDAGQLEKAEEAQQEALKIAPRAGRLHYNYGTMLLQLGRYDQALEHLRVAISRGYDDAGAWVNRGVAEWKLGRLDRAARSFRLALKKDPQDSRAAANLAAVRSSRQER